jgi:hypothetical protein
MRQIDDAHDAEDEVQAEAHQAEVEAEEDAGEERVDEHVRQTSARDSTALVLRKREALSRRAADARVSATSFETALRASSG